MAGGHPVKQRQERAPGYPSGEGSTTGGWGTGGEDAGVNSETGLRSPGSPVPAAGVRGDAGGGEGVSMPPSDFSASHVYFYSSVISASGFWWTHSNNNTVPTATGQGLALPQLGALHLLLGNGHVSNSLPNWGEGPHRSGGRPSRHPLRAVSSPRGRAASQLSDAGSLPSAF